MTPVEQDAEIRRQAQGLGANGEQLDTNILINQGTVVDPRPDTTTIPPRPTPVPPPIQPQPQPQPAPVIPPVPPVQTQPQPAPVAPGTESTAPARNAPLPQPQPAPQPIPQPAPRAAQPQPRPTSVPPQPSRPPVLNPPLQQRPQAVRPPARQGVNWGGIIKGVLLVTAVVFVAFCATAFLSGAIGYLVGAAVAVPVVAHTVNAGAGILGPIGHSLSTMATGVGHWLSGFFGHFAAHLGIGSAAAAPTVAPATTSAISTALTGLGVGTGLALGVPFVAKHMAAAPVIDPNLHHAAQAPNTLDDGGAAAAATMSAKKTQAAQAAAQGQAMDLPDMPDEIAASQSQARAMKLDQGAMTAPERRASVAALRRSTDASQAWTDRTIAEKTNYSSTLAETGSHGEAVRAGQGERRAPQPRQSEFSAQLDQDRAALDAALAQSAR